MPLLVDSAAGLRLASTRPAAGSARIGDLEVFSFHATKPFAIGEGGIAPRPTRSSPPRSAASLNFGLEPGTRVSADVGFNGKLSELHAATGLAMLDMFDDVLVTPPRATPSDMRSRSDGSGVTDQRGVEPLDASSSSQFLMPDADARDAVVAAAPAHGIEVRTLHDPPLHRHPAFAARERSAPCPSPTTSRRARSRCRWPTG